MPTDVEELARLSALEAEIANLRHLTNRMLQGGLFDMLTGHGYQYFGGGAMRLDNFGIQFRKRKSSDRPLPAIYWTPEYMQRDIEEISTTLSAIYATAGAAGANAELTFGSYADPEWSGDEVDSNTNDKAQLRTHADSGTGELELLTLSDGGRARIFLDSNTSSDTRIFMEGTWGWGTMLSPAQITSNQNDYNPTSLGVHTVLRLSTDASRNITGLESPGVLDLARFVFIHNIGAFNIVLTDDDGATSTAANRFALSGNLTLAPDQCALLQYDFTTDRWRCIGTSGSIAGLYEAAGAVTTHEAASDPHTGYVREADANWIDLTDTGATTLHTHAGGSGWAPTVTAQSTGYTAADGDVVLCTGTFTVTLPAATANVRVIVKNVSTGTITVDGAGADTIDGVASLTLAQYDSVSVIADGSTWHIF